MFTGVVGLAALARTRNHAIRNERKEFNVVILSPSEDSRGVFGVIWVEHYKLVGMHMPHLYSMHGNGKGVARNGRISLNNREGYSTWQYCSV